MLVFFPVSMGPVIKKSLNWLQQGGNKPWCYQFRLFFIACPIDIEKKLVCHKIILWDNSKMKHDTDVMQIF